MGAKNIVFIQMTGGRTSSGSGGGLVFQELLAKSLTQRGYSVYAITNTFDLYGFSFLGKRRMTADFHSGTAGSIMGFFLFNRWKLKYEISRFVKTIPEDSVYVTVDPFPADISAARFLNMKLGKNVVVTMHHITPSPLFHPFRRGFARTLIAWLISINALLFIKIQNVPLFLDNKRIATTTGWKLKGNLLEMPLSLPNNHVMKPRDNSKCVCYIGRLSKNKGIADLIKAWKIVIGAVPESRLFLIGTDHGKGKYQRMIIKYNLVNSVVLKGFVGNDEKNEIMEKSSMLAFPSYEEGWGLAVMEALDAGLLPILYDLPAYDYVCSQKVKIRPGNVKKFAETMIYYLRNDEERIDLTKQLQKCISKYSLEYVTTQWVEQIDKVFNDIVN
jgi:glycosyltransferase involved in cell wall biosynthesis